MVDGKDMALPAEPDRAVVNRAMPQSKPDPAMIAKGLTEAQRRAILHAKWSDVFGAYHVPLNTHLTVGRALFAKGLMLRPPGWKLNKRGLAVRDILRSENDGQS